VSFRRCGLPHSSLKNSGIRHKRERHEFHSCHKSRPIKSTAAPAAGGILTVENTFFSNCSAYSRIERYPHPVACPSSRSPRRGNVGTDVRFTFRLGGVKKPRSSLSVPGFRDRPNFSVGANACVLQLTIISSNFYWDDTLIRSAWVGPLDGHVNAQIRP
jgi:hypothetical protein